MTTPTTTDQPEQTGCRICDDDWSLDIDSLCESCTSNQEERPGAQ